MEVMKLVGAGTDGEKRIPSLRRVGLWSLSFRQSGGEGGDLKMQEVELAVRALGKFALLLVDRYGEEWTVGVSG